MTQLDSARSPRERGKEGQRPGVTSKPVKLQRPDSGYPVQSSPRGA